MQTIVIVLVELDDAIVVLSLGRLRDHIVVWVAIVRDECAAVVVASQLNLIGIDMVVWSDISLLIDLDD